MNVVRYNTLRNFASSGHTSSTQMRFPAKPRGEAFSREARLRSGAFRLSTSYEAFRRETQLRRCVFRDCVGVAGDLLVLLFRCAGVVLVANFGAFPGPISSFRRSRPPACSAIPQRAFVCLGAPGSTCSSVLWSTARSRATSLRGRCRTAGGFSFCPCPRPARFHILLLPSLFSSSSFCLSPFPCFCFSSARSHVFACSSFYCGGPVFSGTASVGGPDALSVDGAG